MKLEKMVHVLGAQSSCQSVEPVLHCREGCSPTRTAEHSVNFQCTPLSKYSLYLLTFMLRIFFTSSSVESLSKHCQLLY